MSVTVTDNADAGQFELHEDGELAALTQYRLRPHSVAAFVHTETLPGFERRGHAATVVGQALDAARERGWSVLPYCPFVRSFIQKHPDYLDLVPTDRRGDFELDS